MHELRVHQIELEMQNEELRRAQLALEEARQRWFELFDLAPVGYCTLGATGRILLVNLAAAELLGQPRAGLARRRFVEFLALDCRPSFLALQGSALTSDEPLSCELQLAAGERWVQFTITGAPDAQGLRTLRVVLVDVTARRQAEAAEAALQVAETASRSRAEFLSRVSHELRTPLNAILGFSQLLLRYSDPPLPPQAQRPLEFIQDAGDHLLKLVDDLLDVSRLASGRLEIRSTRVDLMGLLRQAARDLVLQAQAAGVAIAIAPVDGPTAEVTPACEVWADPTRLRQVVLNLLNNAVKYNRRGGQVSARVTREGTYWRLHVIDTGVGMTPAQQAALFQPFNRLGREAEGIQGTGLGLVIVRDLVQAMGGQLTVRSEPGVGSTFMVDLPGCDEPKAAPATGRDNMAEAARPTGTTGRVLVVEDDEPSRALMRGILAARPGIVLDLVGTGAAGIAAARQAWPDLLILDLRLPDMHGLNVLRVLRQLNPHLPLRCLVVSAETSAGDIAVSRAAGADDHLHKPFDPARLLSRVDELLGSRPSPVC